MARIPYVDPDDPNLDPAIRAFMVRPGAASTDVVNVVRALANNGRALHALGQLSRVGDQITKAQRELAWTHCSAEAMWLQTLDGEIELGKRRGKRGLLERLDRGEREQLRREKISELHALMGDEVS